MSEESIFGSHDLVFTQNPKTREYVGGGYLLNSELLNCGAPAFMSGSGSGGGKKRRSKRTKASTVSSNSGDDSDSNSKSDYESGQVKKVSELLHKRVLAIPAGIFLINSATATAKQPSSSTTSSTSFSSTYDDARIRSMFDGNNSDDDDDDDDSDDSSAGAGAGMAKPAVISEDLYSKLFKMLAPNDADRKRYWVSAATTCRARNGIGKCTQESHRGVVPESHAPANKKTRRNRRDNHL
jgi:hypothetical protein